MFGDSFIAHNWKLGAFTYCFFCCISTEACFSTAFAVYYVTSMGGKGEGRSYDQKFSLLMDFDAFSSSMFFFFPL